MAVSTDARSRVQIIEDSLRAGDLWMQTDAIERGHRAELGRLLADPDLPDSLRGEPWAGEGLVDWIVERADALRLGDEAHLGRGLDELGGMVLAAQLRLQQAYQQAPGQLVDRDDEDAA